MSEKEAEIIRYMDAYKEKKISLKRAAELLFCSYRTAKRYWKSYRSDGIKGIISKKRGRPGNRRISPELRKLSKKLLREQYPDFGPTLATEKLRENHSIVLSKETVRSLMIEACLWIPSHKTKIHQRRKRKEREGELWQSDASKHLWFEDRGGKATLFCIIDDATGKIALRFEKEETKDGYFRLFESFIRENGLPKAVYTDRRQVFVINNSSKNGKKTQFQRAMEELKVEMILARSPQAKGRVERVFRTLQDRLIKELRLHNICGIEEGNKFLKSFTKEYNQKFSRQPVSSFNAYRKVPENVDLSQTLCDKETRRVTKNLEISFRGKIYQIIEPEKVRILRKAKVTVIQKRNGEVLVEKNGVLLEARPWEDVPYENPPLEVKELKKKTVKKVSKAHPWKKAI